MCCRSTDIFNKTVIIIVGRKARQAVGPECLCRVFVQTCFGARARKNVRGICVDVTFVCISHIHVVEGARPNRLWALIHHNDQHNMDHRVVATLYPRFRCGSGGRRTSCVVIVCELSERTGQRVAQQLRQSRPKETNAGLPRRVASTCSGCRLHITDGTLPRARSSSCPVHHGANRRAKVHRTSTWFQFSSLSYPVTVVPV